jgi:N-acetylglucosamine kinase-like BadF-type ATPase
MSERERLVLAVDGGQTSSKAIIARLNGEILGWGTGSPCDHLHGPRGYERNRDAIHSAANSALNAAGSSSDEIALVGLGLTSAPRESTALAKFRDMVQELCTPETIWVDSDFVSNLAGASGGEPGVVVIAGGGSIGYGVDDQGNEAIAGGLGYLMGDEGSGWYIGLRAIQEAAKASDKRGPETALLPMVLDHYGISTIRQIIRVLYDASFSREQVSTLTPKVIRIAAAGDAVATGIVTTAGVKLGEMALGAIRQLHTVDHSVQVYPTGGVFSAGAMVMDSFSGTIREGWPGATIQTPRYPPVIGAYIKVLELAGRATTEDIRGRLDEGVEVRSTSL